MNHEMAGQAGDVLESGAETGRRVRVPVEVAEQFARYRTESGESGPYDQCGRPVPGYYDELVDRDGGIRPMWSDLSADFVQLGTGGLGRLDTRVRRLIEDDGITYTEVGAAEEPVMPVPWRLDPIPLLVSADDWTRLETGLTQRSRVLDEVLTDIYSSRRTITSGLLPPELIFGNTGYVRAAHGITVPGRHQLFLHACDISRWGDGHFRAIADWAQAPSGAGYALADRRVVSTAIPESFEHAGPRPLTPFARAMRLMLIESAPVADVDDPMVVVLSPGVHSETAFDQAYLASTLGFPLVESADLVVRDGALWMRSLGTLKRVDVVLRRVDAEFSDPLDLRPDSQLGVVGLVEVLRRGAVTVVNTLGSGLLESPALAGFLPRVSRALLGEELLLDSAPSYWGGEPAELSHLLAKLDRLVIRSAVDGATWHGPGLTAAERADMKARIQATPWQWVGQEPAQFSVAPAIQSYGALAAAPVGMRLFSLARRGGYTAMTGGLGQLRHRLEPDRSVIKVAAKDIWVRTSPAQVTAVATEPPTEERLHRPTPVVEAVSSPRVLNDLFWMGRYSERAEALVRLLIATHETFQDYRYRPRQDGAQAVPVLVSALARTTGTLAPDAVVTIRPAATPPVPQQSRAQRANGSDLEVDPSDGSGARSDPEGRPGPDTAAPPTDRTGGVSAGSESEDVRARPESVRSESEENQPDSGQSQSGSGRPQSSSGQSQSGSAQPQSGSGQPQSGSGQSQSGSGQPQSGSGQSQSGSGQSQSGSGQSQSGSGQSQSSSGQAQPGSAQPQSGSGQPQSGFGQSQTSSSQSQSGSGASQSGSGQAPSGSEQAQSSHGSDRSISDATTGQSGPVPDRSASDPVGSQSGSDRSQSGRDRSSGGARPPASPGTTGPEARRATPDSARLDPGAPGTSGARDVPGAETAPGAGDGPGTGEPASESGSPGRLPGDPPAPELPSVTGRPALKASTQGRRYLVSLTVDRDLPGSLAFALDRYGSAARAVRDQLSNDTWMILGALERALAEYRATDDKGEAGLSAVHSLSLAALLSLSGIGAESMVRDTGWYVMDIGKRIERGLALTALMSAALTKGYHAETERAVAEAVLRATESSVSYRRRHRDSVRVAALAGLLLFDAGNPRSLAYQLDRLVEDFRELPGTSGSSRPQRLLADAQHMLRRVDPADLEAADDDGLRVELAELLDGVHLRLRKVSESFETTKLSVPLGIQPLWGSTRIVG